MRLLKLGFLLPVVGLGLGALAQPASADVHVSAELRLGGGTVNVAARLAPYGRWTVDRVHGRVFIPSDTSYTPYTQGHWAEDGASLTWVSDVPYGQVTEHYGRWIQTGDRWAWVPGDDYSPGWVEWRDAGEAVGWAPLGPDGRGVRDARYVPVEALGTRRVRDRYVSAPARYTVMSRPGRGWAAERARQRRFEDAQRRAEDAERRAEDAQRRAEQAHGIHAPHAEQARRDAQAERRAQQQQRRYEQMMRRGGPGADPAADRRDRERDLRDAARDRRAAQAARRDGFSS